MTRLALAALLLLTACAHQPSEPVIRTIEVKVPVAVSCVPNTFPGEPTFPDTDAALRSAPGAADRYQLIAAGRLLRIARLSELETVVKGCR